MKISEFIHTQKINSFYPLAEMMSFTQSEKQADSFVKPPFPAMSAPPRHPAIQVCICYNSMGL